MSKFTDWAFPKIQDDKPMYKAPNRFEAESKIEKLRKEQDASLHRWTVVFWISAGLAVFGHIMAIITAI